MSPGGKCDVSRLFFRRPLCPSERGTLGGYHHGMFITNYRYYLLIEKVDKKRDHRK